jgi:hypothetical protein
MTMAAWSTIVACGIVLVLPIAWRVRAGRFDPFEPFVLFALAYSVMFVVRPAAMLIRDERFFWDLDVMPTLPRALVVALVGAVGFVIGYELRAGEALAARLPAPTTVDSRTATRGALLTALVALLALFVLLPVSEGFDSLRVVFSDRDENLGELLRDSSTYLIYTTYLLAPAALILVALALRDRTPRSCALAAVALVLAVARVTPTGGRIVLLPLLGGICVLAYVMRDRRPSVPVLAGLAVVAMLGSFLLLQIRDPGSDATLASAVEELGERPQALFDPILRNADAEMVLALSGALTVVPDELERRWGGATLGNLVSRPIPRELWSGKPRPPGEEVVATVWPRYYPYLDPAFSPLLVLYWDFGLPGAAAGMALFGLLARMLYAWFLRHREGFGAQLVFAACLWLVVIGARNDPVDTLVLGTFLVGPVVAVAFHASRRASRPEAELASNSAAPEASSLPGRVH